MEYTIYFINRNNEEQELDLDIDYSISNDGIGPYEFWGQRCIDKGHDYAEIEEIKYDKKNLTEDEIKEIEKVIEKELEEIERACMQDASFAKEAYEEDRYDDWKADN